MSWRDFERLCDLLAKRLEGQPHTKIYGIPRGGAYVALALAQRLNYTMVSKQDYRLTDTIVVNDISDTGKTLLPFTKDHAVTATLHHRGSMLVAPNFFAERIPAGEWVVYPWESEEGAGQPIEDYVVRLLQCIGEDPRREGLVATPQRVRRALLDDMLAGYKQSPVEIMQAQFTDQYDEIVLARDIEFYSMCEHHILPFYGQAHVGYIPNGKVLGLSKLARLVDCFARRLQLQERLTEQIAHALMDTLQPLGVGVILKAKHLCMMARGVHKQHSDVVTSCMLGILRRDMGARQEFLSLCAMKGGI